MDSNGFYGFYGFYGRSNPPLSFGPIMLSLLILAGLLFRTNAVTILSILDTMCEGVGRQALEKIIFESPRVLAIVILPYSDKSLCDHKLNIFCILVAFS